MFLCFRKFSTERTRKDVAFTFKLESSETSWKWPITTTDCRPPPRVRGWRQLKFQTTTDSSLWSSLPPDTWEPSHARPSARSPRKKRVTGPKERLCGRLLSCPALFLFCLTEILDEKSLLGFGRHRNVLRVPRSLVRPSARVGWQKTS